MSIFEQIEVLEIKEKALYRAAYILQSWILGLEIPVSSSQKSPERPSLDIDD